MLRGEGETADGRTNIGRGAQSGGRDRRIRYGVAELGREPLQVTVPA